MMSSSGRSSNSMFPFTTTQWQELEHQALAFKYMISGIQIPQDLLFTIRRSLDDDSSDLSSKLLLHHPPPPSPQHMIGWNGYHHHQQQQMGLGYHLHHRKIDAEPGRCRRTDGKKWRCSREAYTDSKYCERHMHRGRNRSRKPVENITLSSPPTPTTKPSTNNNTNTAIPNTINNTAHHSSSAQSKFLYSHNTPPSSSEIPFPSSSQQCSTKFFMESNPFRNSHVRETDEHRFLSPEINSSNGGVNDSSLKMGSSALFEMRENSSAYNSSGLENWQQQLQSLTRQQNHHDYCCNNSYSSYDHMPPPLSIDDRDEADPHHQTTKVMHHFLNSWPDSEDHHHQKSVPNSLHDFFMTEKW